MKIRFLIGYPPKYCSSNWQEIKRLSKKEIGPDEETFILFKSLELNQDFGKAIVQARKNLRLRKEGLSFKDYLRRRDSRANHTKKELNDIIFFIRNKSKEIDKILGKMHLHSKVKEQLDDLILGGFVEPFYGVFQLGADPVDDIGEKESIKGPVEVVKIYITRKMKKNELISLIDKSWDDLSKLIDLLPDDKFFYISSRDLRVVELRDKYKLKYKDIADRIIGEFSIDNLRGNLNEDSIKTAYRRAKHKIQKLAKPGGK